MISWIIFIIGSFISISLSYLTSLNSFSFMQIILFFTIELIIIILLNTLCALFFAKWLPDELFNKKFKLFNPGKKEIALYNKLHIKNWKDHTVEWGKLNGFSKSKIENPKDPEYVKKFIMECNKGFLAHFTSLFVAGFIFVFVPDVFIFTMALPMFITSLVLNLLPILILRYNTHRLNTLLRFLERNKNKQN